MRVYLLIGFLFVMPSVLAINKPALDSLRALYPKLETKAQRAEALATIAYLYASHSSEQAQLHLDSAERMDIQTPKVEAFSAATRGINLFHQGFYEKALAKTQTATQLFDSLSLEKELMASYNQLMMIHTRLHNYSKALYFAQKLLAYFKKGNRRATILLNVGLIYQATSRLDSATHYFIRSLRLKESPPVDSLGVVIVSTNLVGVFTKLDDNDKALQYNNKLLG